jgi:hypothetical protein
MPGLVEFFIVITRLFPVGFWWNNGLDAFLLKNFQDPLIGIKGFVSQQCACFEIGQESIRSLPIASLTGCQNKVEGIAKSIDNGVDFCAQSTFRASDGLLFADILGVLTPFLRAPAACGWARTIVESIIAYSWSPSAANALKRPFQTPLADPRENRVWTAFHEPKRSGRSRHGIPARYRYKTASTNSRLSLAVTPTVSSRPGKRPSILSH